MSRAHPADLKAYLDKEICVKLNGSRVVQGIFRGNDPFMNLTLHNVFEVVSKDEVIHYPSMVVRGNSISSFSDPQDIKKL